MEKIKRVWDPAQAPGKRALAMEGGAMRGMFTCGVLDVLMENGVGFDIAAGISAGAVFGCNLKSGQAGRAVRYNKRFCRDKRYGTLLSLIRTGDLYEADFCYREIPDELDVFDRKAFRENPMLFYAGAADADTGEIVYHLCRDGEKKDMDWLRASASMPGVSRPVPLDGRRLLDGGVVEPVPCAFLRQLGFERQTVILTRPKGYRKKDGPFLPLMRLMLRKTPGAARAMGLRAARYNAQMEDIDARQARGELFVLCPAAPLEIDRLSRDPQALERMYVQGRREAEERLPALQEFLKSPF